MRILYSRSLRSPFGFQCFPSLIFPKVPNYSVLPIHLCSFERLSCVLTQCVSVYFEPSSDTRSQEHPIFTEVNTFILLRACLSNFTVRDTPHLHQLSPVLMAHYRSRIGSLVGWGLPVTLGAPTPLLGSGKVSVAQGAQ